MSNEGFTLRTGGITLKISNGTEKGKRYEEGSKIASFQELRYVVKEELGSLSSGGIPSGKRSTFTNTVRVKSGDLLSMQWCDLRIGKKHLLGRPSMGSGFQPGKARGRTTEDSPGWRGRRASLIER